MICMYISIVTSEMQKEKVLAGCQGVGVALARCQVIRFREKKKEKLIQKQREKSGSTLKPSWGLEAEEHGKTNKWMIIEVPCLPPSLFPFRTLYHSISNGPMNEWAGVTGAKTSVRGSLAWHVANSINSCWCDVHKQFGGCGRVWNFN